MTSDAAPPAPTDPQLAALLDAHVAFELRRFQGAELEAAVRSEVEHALARAHELTLDDVVDRADVKAVAAKYVAGAGLPGAIPDLAGEIAMRIRTHAANATAAGEVLPRPQLQALFDKLAELRSVREAVVARFVASPSVQDTVAEFLRAVASDPVGMNRRLGRMPGVRSAMSMGERLAGGALREIDQVSRELSTRFAGVLLERSRVAMTEALTDEALAATLLDVWDGVADRPVDELFTAISEDDLVDLVVIGYELWLELRGNPYLHSLIDAGIDYVFDTYGVFALDDLLAEFGLGQDDLVEEAMRFAPRAVDALLRTGLLEDLVRRRLAAFYCSAEARTAAGAGTAAGGASSC